MSRVEEGGFKAHDIKLIQEKRIVFIIDEAHRDVFGEMLRTIKETFPNAMFFGFTGTPIHEENLKKMSTTSDVFGNELHRYSISDGIRDRNVLGFDPCQIMTYKDRDLRKAVALEKAKASTEAGALADPKKKKIYLHYIDHTKTPMAGFIQPDGTYVKGIEDYLPNSQYEREEHQKAVVQDVLYNWMTLSHDSKFHAIFATSSITESIQYYKLFKAESRGLKITALFDPNIDNNGTGIIKEDAIVEIVDDYNKRYGMEFRMSTYSSFKKDIAYRLAHKEQYKSIESKPEQQIDLLIVVDQMLTGFDSKWINTLYMDKVCVYEKLIQAFSRTNRLYGPEKPFGTIRYYRRPHTMKRNIENAFKLYSGDKPLGLFADKLEYNLSKMNEIFDDIDTLFCSAGIENFEKLPENNAERGVFAKLFKRFNNYMEAAKIQGFTWDKLSYEFDGEVGKIRIDLHLDKTVYLILALRYKELFGSTGGGYGGDVPYEIDTYLTEINTGVIDADYMNSRFKKYLKALQDGEETAAVLVELHKSFATLTQEEQKYANIFLHDVQNGEVTVEDGKTLRDYITEYMTRAKNDQIHRFSIAIGVDEIELRSIMQLKVTDANINEFGRFDRLKATIDTATATAYLEKANGKSIKPFQVNMKIDQVLRKFILEGGFDIE
jgi:type I restriction enzyme R subunit